MVEDHPVDRRVVGKEAVGEIPLRFPLGAFYVDLSSTVRFLGLLAALAALSQFGASWPSKTIARHLCDQHPKLFTSLERARSIVDQDLGRVVPRDGFYPDAARLLPGGAADEGERQIETLHSFCEHCFMAFADNRLNMIDRGVRQKCLARPPDHGPAADELILFGPFTPCAQAGAAGHDHRRNCHEDAVASAIQPRKKGP